MSKATKAAEPQIKCEIFAPAGEGPKPLRLKLETTASGVWLCAVDEEGDVDSYLLCVNNNSRTIERSTYVSESLGLKLDRDNRVVID